LKICDQEEGVIEGLQERAEASRACEESDSQISRKSLDNFPPRLGDLLVQSEDQTIELLSGRGGLLDDLRWKFIAHLLHFFGSRGVLGSVDCGVRWRSGIFCGRHFEV
jgi:hypothetical protein